MQKKTIYLVGTTSLNFNNLTIEAIKTIQLPERKGERNVIFLSSTKKCPDQYPRSIGIPMKSPLTI